MQCGLLGGKLGHSYSPQIHSHLGAYSYKLFEKQPEELEDFLKHGDFTGLNVTIPYKKAVIPYCAELSERAKALGAVNTIVRRADGSLIGHNTDYFGFETMLRNAPEIMSPLKVAKFSPFGKNRVYEMIRTKELKAYKYQNTYIIAKIDLVEYLADHCEDGNLRYFSIKDGDK